MRLEKLNSMPTNIRPRGRYAGLIYDFIQSGAKWAKIVDVPEGTSIAAMYTGFKNEALRPRHGLKVRIHITEDDIIILERRER